MAALHKRTNFDYIATREAAAVQEALLSWMQKRRSMQLESSTLVALANGITLCSILASQLNRQYTLLP